MRRTHRFPARVIAIAIAVALPSLAARGAAAQQQPKVDTAKSIEPYHAQEIQPYKAQEIQPTKAQEIQPTRAKEVQPARSSGIPVYKAQEVKPIGPAGVDVVTPQRAPDASLVGTWDLAIPGVAYQTEADRGSYTERTLHTGAGAAFGRLTIGRGGAYSWTKSGETARGRLVQVAPRRDAAEGATYWMLQHGGERFYLTRSDDGTLAVYTVGANSYVATGHRAR